MKFFTILLVFVLSNTSIYPQWQIQNSGTTEILNDVAVLNQTTAIVVGENGTILKTTDNGLNWVAKNSGGSFDFNAVSFRDEQNGIAVGNSAFNLTTDGGESWLAANFNENALTISYRYWSGNSNVIIGCDSGTVFYSSNGGNSWYDPLFFPYMLPQPIRAVGFNYITPGSPTAYAATTPSTAVNFSFPSNEWNFFTNPIYPPLDYITGGEFYDLNQFLIGFQATAGYFSPFLLKRIDSDTTWQMNFYIIPQSYIPRDIKGMNEILFICGINGKIFKSTNGGDNWFEQYTNITEHLNAIDFINDTIGYSVGNNGTILFTSNGGISSMEEVLSLTGYYLYQNYPNPFNPATNIRFGIAERGIVSLVVFDILGREITRLVDEEKPAGEYTVEFNAEGLTSGIYFYQLVTEQFTQTKKMLLIR